MEIDTPTTFTAQAAQEVRAATAALAADDEVAGRSAAGIRLAIDAVNIATTKAASEAARLHSDDLMNVEGKQRLLSELPGKLRADTEAALEDAETSILLNEGRHLERILHSDGKDDENLRFEIGNYCANLEKKDATATMVGLAADSRYAAFLAGNAGRSIAARFGFDPAILRKVALESLAINGSPAQVRHSQALASIPAARRALGLARGGRDQVADQVQRAPRRSASAVNALMQ
jgi:hypothetical protein